MKFDEKIEEVMNEALDDDIEVAIRNSGNVLKNDLEIFIVGYQDVMYREAREIDNPSEGMKTVEKSIKLYKTNAKKLLKIMEGGLKELKKDLK